MCNRRQRAWRWLVASRARWVALIACVLFVLGPALHGAPTHATHVGPVAAEAGAPAHQPNDKPVHEGHGMTHCHSTSTCSSAALTAHSQRLPDQTSGSWALRRTGLPRSPTDYRHFRPPRLPAQA